MIRFAFKFILYAGALTTGGLIAASMFREKVEGSGTPATEDRDVGSVTEVELAGVGNLVLVHGDVPGLTVRADDNILPLLESDISGKKLILRTRSGFDLQPKTPITYTLTVPKLTKLSITGSGGARAEQLSGDALAVNITGSGKATLAGVEYKSLTIRLTGSGNATVSGTAETVTTRISGSGEINAEGLKVKTAEVRVSGSGNARVWATDHLKVRVSGSGNIHYKGDPQLEQKVSGSGRVKPL
jgi:hypothetical protein